MWPWAAVYAGSVALGMLVWNVFYGIGGFGGLVAGTISAIPFAILTAALWRAEALFDGERSVSLRERYGDWALVTGASAGIGAEFARALAREGLSCVLVARRADRLEGLASELEKTWQVSTRVVPEDLSDPQGPARVAAAVSDLPVAVLVNNAGVGYSGRFGLQDTDRLRAMVQLNCAAPVDLTSRLLPGMEERGRGAVIVVGSVAGRQPLPLHGVYAATKAFDQLFGEALFVELRAAGIDALVLEPGPTETEFQAAAGELAHEGESAAEVVETALAALGRQPSVVSGWGNWLRATGTRLAPRTLTAWLARDVMTRFTPTELR
jgi:short-subunit dehydrogenase